MNTTRLCPRCYHSNPSAARFCALCGTSVEPVQWGPTARPRSPLRGLVWAFIIFTIFFVVLNIFYHSRGYHRVPHDQQWFHQQSYPVEVREEVSVGIQRSRNHRHQLQDQPRPPRSSEPDRRVERDH